MPNPNVMSGPRPGMAPVNIPSGVAEQAAAQHIGIEAARTTSSPPSAQDRERQYWADVIRHEMQTPQTGEENALHAMQNADKRSVAGVDTFVSREFAGTTNAQKMVDGVTNANTFLEKGFDSPEVQGSAIRVQAMSQVEKAILDTPGLESIFSGLSQTEKGQKVADLLRKPEYKAALREALLKKMTPEQAAKAAVLRVTEQQVVEAQNQWARADTELTNAQTKRATAQTELQKFERPGVGTNGAMRTGGIEGQQILKLEGEISRNNDRQVVTDNTKIATEADGEIKKIDAKIEELDAKIKSALAGGLSKETQDYESQKQVQEQNKQAQEQKRDTANAVMSESKKRVDTYEGLLAQEQQLTAEVARLDGEVTRLAGETKADALGEAQRIRDGALDEVNKYATSVDNLYTEAAENYFAKVLEVARQEEQNAIARERVNTQDPAQLRLLDAIESRLQTVTGATDLQAVRSDIQTILRGGPNRLTATVMLEKIDEIPELKNHMAALKARRVAEGRPMTPDDEMQVVTDWVRGKSDTDPKFKENVDKLSGEAIKKAIMLKQMKAKLPNGQEIINDEEVINLYNGPFGTRPDVEAALNSITAWKKFKEQAISEGIMKEGFWDWVKRKNQGELSSILLKALLILLTLPVGVAVMGGQYALDQRS